MTVVIPAVPGDSDAGASLSKATQPLRALVQKMSGGRLERLTKKRAERDSLLQLYHEVLVILDRILAEGVPATRYLDNRLKRPSSRNDPVRFRAALTALSRLAVDLKSLYHWTYAIEDFLADTAVGAKLDLRELKRINIFRHKLMVHQAQTPMRRRGHVPFSAHSWPPGSDAFRLVTHPIHRGSAVWRARSGAAWGGYIRKMARLNRYVPGLKEEGNVWVKTDLIYHHFNSLPATEQGWVRDDLFGAVGLQSDPPAVIVNALRQALFDYKRRRRI